MKAEGEETQFAPPRSLRALYLGFLSVGARSFGGVLPWAHRALVEERRWIAPGDFSEMLALCQFLPGPNVGNLSVVLGRRWFGWRGALVASLGLYGLPFVWVLVLAFLYQRYSMHPAVNAVVTGVGVAGAGLFLGTAVKLAKPFYRRPVALALIAACFCAAALARVSLLIVLPVAFAVAYAAARRGAL